MLKTSWLVAQMACNLNPTMTKRESKRKLCGVLKARGRCMQRRTGFKLELGLKCGESMNTRCSSLGLWLNQPVPKGKGGDIRASWYKAMGKGVEFLIPEVWSMPLFCMLQLTIREQGLLKCREKGNGKFPIGASILP